MLLLAASGIRGAAAATLPYAMNLPCGQGAGNVGTWWISLPNVNPTINGTPVVTAEDLCALIPNATSVSQAYGSGVGGGAVLGHEWTFDCLAQSCSASTLTPPPPEAGCCSSSCFCVNPGEGYRVTVSAPSSFTISGSETPDLLKIPGGARDYLISVPFNSCLTTAADLANATGLPSTGVQRGSVTALNGCTGSVISCNAGTAACTALTLVPGMGYRIRYLDSLVHAYTNPVAGDFDADGLANCAENCPTIANPLQENGDGDGRGDACDNCPAVSNSSQVDLDADGRGDACDNCPLSPNFIQTDGDIDLRGDVCDNCPANPNAGQSDVDRDGSGDACDICAGGGSRNVAIVDSASCANGGALPTSGVGETGSLATYSYFTVPVGGVTASQLAPGGACGAEGCDTVLLNVCSAGMACTTAGLSAAEKADLGAFVGDGHKLIIYDSECPGVDYSWLPIPFTTSPLNTAAVPGTVGIVEENSLSSSQPTESHFIDTSILGGVCTDDHVQSANVLQTQNAGWCVDMSATKGASGPVHLYATYGSSVSAIGLIIYNGLDLDGSCGDIPGTLTACQNFSKIWLQELQQPVDPSCLPCEQHVVSCDDENPCTDDVFNPFNGGCTHTPNFNPCDDGNACTTGDTCSFNNCVGGPPVTCTASDQCHVAGVCDPGTGLCSNPEAPNGTACSDGDACTHTDVCQSGVCTGSHEDICNCLDDDCDGTVDEDCLVKVVGAPIFPIPGGTLSSGFSAYRLVPGPPHSNSGITTTDSATGLKVKSTLVQTLCASGNTAMFTGTCKSGLAYPLVTPCTFSAVVVDGVLDEFTITVPEPPAQYGPVSLPPQSISITY